MNVDDRFRVNAQLIDLNGGKHVWAEHYDKTTSNVLDVLDSIAKSVSATTIGRIEAAEHRATFSVDPSSLEADGLTLRAQAYYNQVSKDAHSEAVPLLEMAIKDNNGHSRAPTSAKRFCTR